MGQQLETMSPKVRNSSKELQTNRYSREEVPSSNGLMLGDIYLPEEIVALILSFVDSIPLIKSCMLVCHKWHEIIQEDVWKIKAERDFSKRLSNVKAHRKLPSLVYQGICCKDCYSQNLLKNNSGLEQLSNWTISENGGDGWQVEEPPCGVLVSTPIPAINLEPKSCFVTSYHDCSKQQVIDLFKAGIHPDILDNYQPDIIVSEWHAARWDCGSVYNLKVLLLDKTQAECKRFESNIRMTNWTDGWKEVKHTFSDYGVNVRYMSFYHSGCDLQFWAGHYGSKMANAMVTVDLASIEQKMKSN